MIPGMGRLAAKLPEGAQEEQLKKAEAIVLSMTAEERQNPSIIGGAARSASPGAAAPQTHDVNQLLNQFTQMQKLMKMSAGGKIPRNMMEMFGQK